MVKRLMVVISVVVVMTICVIVIHLFVKPVVGEVRVNGVTVVPQSEATPMDAINGAMAIAQRPDQITQTMEELGLVDGIE